jgi:transcriptional regulator GlxA family with amidase domain
MLEERFDEALMLDELAAVAGLSRFHLQRVFTAEIGMGPHAYQTQVRINRAKELLRRNVPLAEVATRAGFADQSHLHRHFTRRVGITPGQYAR